MKTILGLVVVWGIAIFIAWLIWGLAAPALCRMVPAGDWKGIADVAIYLVVAGLGGVGLPLMVGIAGTGFVVELS